MVAGWWPSWDHAGRMREWNKAAFETALETAERMEGAALDERTVQWMRWAYLQAWLSPLGYAYEVRHEDATIGPVTWDQLIRARTENKIPEGAEARIVGAWTPVADLVAGRSLDPASYESSRSFFEDADGQQQLVRRIVSALMKLPRVDDALMNKIEADARARGWIRKMIPITKITSALDERLSTVVPGGELVGASFGDHQFHCLRRGALSLGLQFRTASSFSTLMLYAFRFWEGAVLITSPPVS
jgi:hypothetical protein